MTSLRSLILLLAFFFLNLVSVWGADKCKEDAQEVLIPVTKTPRPDILNLPKFRVPLELLEASLLHQPQSPPTLELGLRSIKNRFEKAALDRLGPDDTDKLIKTLAAMRFIDYVHLAPKLIDIFRRAKPGTLINSNLDSIYDEGPKSTVFLFAESARKFLKFTKLTPGLERLCEVQRIAMQNGVEGLDPSDLGTVRSVAVKGLQPEPFTKSAIKTIRNNLYLNFVETGQDEDLIFGEIHYPSLYNVKTEALDRIRKAQPELCSKIESLQSSSAQVGASEEAQLTRQLVTALANERYEFFNQKSAELVGKLPEISALHAYIKLVAEHFRDIVSIHPLVNGNGRSVRFESLYDPLDKIGIPRPRLNDPDRDILASPSQWVEEVERGIWNNYFLYKDMTFRLELGLPLENSPELFSPQLSYAIGIRKKNSDKKILDENLALVPLDSGQFPAFLKLKFLQDPNWVVQMKKEPLRTQKQLKEEFKVFVRGRRFLYKNSENSETEYIAQHLIDPDYYHSFGQVWATNPLSWRAKIDRWFNADSLVWRGLPYGKRALSDEDVLAMFTSLSDHSLAMNLVNTFPNSPVSKKNFAKAKRAVLDEFDRFNHRVHEGSLAEVIQDHISEGPQYPTSFGYSTSKNWGTARKYAWKREPDVSNGESEWIIHEGTKVVVGAYPAKHDIDLSRLKVLEGGFSYQVKKGDRVVNVNRQKEVLGVGAADPDSIMIVQILNDRGNVIFTYSRNPMNPSEIWKVKGRFRPEIQSSPSPSKIERTFSLQR